MQQWFTKFRIIAIVVVIVVVGGGYYFYKKSHQSTYEMITAQTRTVVQAVSVTGRVTPASEINLSFETAGTVNRLAVDTGAVVKTHDTLATLQSSQLSAALAQANAAVAVQQANVDALKQGTRLEQLAITKTQADNAAQAVMDAQNALADTQSKADVDLQNIYNSVPDTLHTAYVNADDAVTKEIDQLFTGVQSNSPHLSYTTADSTDQLSAESGRLSVSADLEQFLQETQALGDDHGALDRELVLATHHLAVVRNLLEAVSATLNAPTNLSTTTLATYKGYVNTARTNVNTASTSIAKVQQSISSQVAANRSAISAATTSLNNAKSASAVAQDNLRLQQAGSTPEQIAGAVASLKQAQANAAAAAARLATTIITAPIDGVITKRNVEVGESVAPNMAIFSMISSSGLDIEANIPEVDIGKVAVGNAVSMTLDAYPGETFTGKVTAIDPAETVVEGVVNYRVKTSLDHNDPRVKSGLTANLSIETSRKENVVSLPQYAIVENDQGTFVRILKADKTTEDVPVKIGLRGADGYVEIVSGVNAGDSVINVGAKSGS